ncbi:hypothetical protein JDV02_007309 [Purpureocillium takamizusanense]|uniref:Uncharacterized protein n=1 Tax=Purpureocillium takamizusanense TaxID=2060973 RepID=A0A9Q8QKA6_9HYPO|nr:uncharacterized protein JDV02_007309 [Purpureocillium takamizusanense]UNI21308.1 hypothetical protein JDV02_007309 [Purpureocillium takamizusanense]
MEPVPVERLGMYMEDAFTVSDTSAIERLREFSNLQELSMDQVSIYSPSDTGPEIHPGRLCRLLPPMLRKLRIMYVYRGMGKDIQVLRNLEWMK